MITSSLRIVCSAPVLYRRPHTLPVAPDFASALPINIIAVVVVYSGTPVGISDSAYYLASAVPLGPYLVHLFPVMPVCLLWCWLPVAAVGPGPQCQYLAGTANRLSAPVSSEHLHRSLFLAGQPTVAV